MKQNGGVLNKIAQLQKRMTAVQAEIGAQVFEGTAANNLVKVKVTGHGELKRIDFDPALAGEDLETLGDLVVAAVSHAHTQKEAFSKKKLATITAGAMPFGMKVPG